MADPAIAAAHGEDAAAALLAAATAGCAPELAQRLMLDVVDAAGLSGDPENQADDAAGIAAALQMMAAAAPRDPLEAMLAAQMAAVHGAAMRVMKRAAECTEYPQIEALYARQAARLMTLFMRQTEALERRRERADKRGAVARHADEDRTSPPSPTPPPVEGEGLYWRKRNNEALSRPGGGGLGGGGTRQGRVSQKKRNGRHRPINGTGPPT